MREFSCMYCNLMNLHELNYLFIQVFRFLRYKISYKTKINKLCTCSTSLAFSRFKSEMHSTVELVVPSYVFCNNHASRSSCLTCFGCIWTLACKIRWLTCKPCKFQVITIAQVYKFLSFFFEMIHQSFSMEDHSSPYSTSPPQVEHVVSQCSACKSYKIDHQHARA